MRPASFEDLYGYREFLTKKRVETQILTKKQSSLQKEKEQLSQLSIDLEQARDIINRVGILAQVETKSVIESLVSQALQSVFGLEYSFEMEDVIQRNKPETTFYVVISGRRHLLKSELGGGVVDLVSFCLRVVLWAINTPRTDAVLIFDEPLKFVDQTRQERVGDMIRKLSEMLGLQFIINTHEDVLAQVADKTFLVEKIKGVSLIKVLV